MTAITQMLPHLKVTWYGLLVNDSPEGKMFEYRIDSTMSFKSGMAWFATTALGKAIFAGIALAVFPVVLSHLGIYT